MSAPASTWNPRGSRWSRWDPHIHTPGTINNDLFNGDWLGYIKAINEAAPVIRALGVTDYYSLESYKEVRRRKTNGELPKVGLVFPNVEVRLDIKTEKKALNLHLLFSPDDPQHESEIERVLGLLIFEYLGTPFQCTTSGLIALGRRHRPAHVADNAAYQEGTKQFKISYKELRQLFRGDQWLRENCLVAVAASQGDGLSGLQADDAFTAMREEIQRLAHVIFSGKPNDRDFWLGRKEGDSRDVIEKKYGGLKPCLHGCDAHRLEDVGRPDEERFCWIKGDLSFETLRQAVIEPGERVHIGASPPSVPASSITLDTVRSVDTPWLKNASVPLNAGLVAVIGARGSGKTALVDMIAAGARALEYPLSESSFLRRAVSASNFSPNASIQEIWADGRTVSAPFTPPGEYDFPEIPEVCYLSQQFVDRLCSSGGLAVELRHEIERVIFDQTEKSDRLDTTNFSDLSKALLDPVRRRRSQQSAAIAVHSTKIAAEQKMMEQLESLRTGRKTLNDTLVKQREELAKLIPKGQEERAKRLADIETACTAAESSIESLKKRRLTLDNLLSDAEYEYAQAEPLRFGTLQDNYADAGLTHDQWSAFRQVFAGNFRSVVATAKAVAQRAIKHLEEGDPDNQIDLSRAALADWPLSALKAEREKIKKAVGLDIDLQKKYNALKKAIDDGDTALKKADVSIKQAEAAEERRNKLVQNRRDIYRDLFDTIVEERDVLAKLYEPLQLQLAGAEGALARLRFSVKRVVAFDQWVRAGEDLFDLRKTSRFQGHGSLAGEAARSLQPAWTSGDAEAVATAMQKFVLENMKELQKAIPASDAGRDEAEWRRRLGDWLYSSEHITTEYGLEYDETAVEQLSPGTRGIVLLLLFLAIDRHDRRPLLIDQPEENLDPRSVFLDLVPHFREARRRRQIVIVTHNANLVVNTDADQVIVATSTPTTGGGLPDIAYAMGSLENPEIRRAVCDILEGGERAFLERERRYRLQWEQMLEDETPGRTPLSA